MKVKFYGVRGSYATPGKDFIKYGGNTTCVSITKEVDGNIHRIVIDAGTGIINLGKEIIGNYFQKKENLEIPVFFTHLHPDHTQGFSFFAPNYFKDAELKLYGMETLEKHIGHILKEQMTPPTFPIEYHDLKSNREHINIKGGDKIVITKEYDVINATMFEIEVMQAFSPSHPQQGALYYKIYDPKTRKRVVCIWDNESHIGGDKAVINFAKDCDVMIHDTQYTKEEYDSDKMVVQGFGHSTYEMAIDNARQSNIKSKLICTHFNPAHTDSKLNEIQKNLNAWRHKIDSQRTKEDEPHSYSFETILAQEGLEIEV